MATNPNVIARFSDPDKAALRELAARLQRSQSDVLRVLVRETLVILQEQDKPGKTGPKRRQGTLQKVAT